MNKRGPIEVNYRIPGGSNSSASSPEALLKAAYTHELEARGILTGAAIKVGSGNAGIYRGAHVVGSAPNLEMRAHFDSLPGSGSDAPDMPVRVSYGNGCIAPVNVVQTERSIAEDLEARAKEDAAYY